jgi:hypothetical protein
MEYVIEISENKGYIIIKASGEVDPNIAMKYTEEAHILAKENGIDNFLVDLTAATNKLHVIENYEFAYDKVAPNPVINKLAKIALLVSPNDHSHDFIETVLINTGVLVRLFRNKEMALDYLGIAED